MHKTQMTLWLDEPADTDGVWLAMTADERRRITEYYAKAIGKAARAKASDRLIVRKEGRDDETSR